MPVTDRTQPVDLAAAVYAEERTAILPLWWPADIGRCACPAGTACTDNAAKHPLTVNGVHDATDDVDQIEKWWTRWPTANIGGAIPADLCVVDIDPRNGGADTWQQLAQGRPVWTLTCLSGRLDNGRHLWLRKPDGPIRGKLGPGVDVKQAGGYVLLPPSVHAQTMDCYRWVDESVPIAEPPSWLAEALRPPVRVPRPILPNGCDIFGWSPGGLLHRMGQAVNGERNNILFWCACRIGEDVAAGRVTERRALEVLDVLAEVAETTGLSPFEVERTIRSGYRR